MTGERLSQPQILEALDRAGRAPPHAERAAIHPQAARQAAALIRSLTGANQSAAFVPEIFEGESTNGV